MLNESHGAPEGHPSDPQRPLLAANAEQLPRRACPRFTRRRFALVGRRAWVTRREMDG